MMRLRRDLVQIELNRYVSFVASTSGASNFTLGAQQADAPTAAHAIGEVGWGVLGGPAAGWHGLKVSVRVAGVESVLPRAAHANL